jgi:hypothetical protein
MKSKSVTIAVCGLALLFQTAYAQNDTFTQVGPWSCVVPGTASLPFACPRVNFPTEFGGTPVVVITPEQVTIQNVTSQGFTPVSLVKAPPINLPVPVLVNLPLSGIWIAVGPRLFTGEATAKYQILTVIYAPPGCNGGKVGSSVSYGAGFTTGTTTSASQSFQNSIGVSVRSEAGFLGSGGELSLSFEATTKSTDTQSCDIKKSETTTLICQGPGNADGVVHNYDTIYLLLKPKIQLALSSSAAAWTFGDNSDSRVVWVYAGELNGKTAWRPGVQEALATAGITPADYPTILASDPLESSEALDSHRYSPTNYIYPYEGPLTGKDSVNALQHTITTSSTVTTGSSTQDTYQVGLSVTGSLGFLGLAKATLKNTDTWTWTNSSSASMSSGTTQSASLTIGGPAFGYPPGIMEVVVYTDTIYGTYAFVLVPPDSLRVAVKGILKTTSGEPVKQGEEIDLNENGIDYHTITNAKGEYVFYGNMTGPATITAAGKTQVIRQFQQPMTFDLQVQ